MGDIEFEPIEFSTPEKRADGKYRVTVEIANQGKFAGAGRNQKSAKASAARVALQFLKKCRAERELFLLSICYYYHILDELKISSSVRTFNKNQIVRVKNS